MKHRHFVLTLTLMTILSLIPACAAQGSTLAYAKGDQIQDFTFTTYQGEQFSLYEILAEKEAVLINVWATWCGPCRNEFPYLQEAYEQYQDRVEVIALSCEPSDTPKVLSEFAEKYGLTFKIGQDPVGFLTALRTSSIPTSLMIDRYGTICFVESGAMPDADSFIRLFDAFLGDDYTESVLLDGIPPKKPNIPQPTHEELSAALNAEDGAVSFDNPSNSYTWPMVMTEKDGRMVAASSNTGVNSSRAAVEAAVHALKDDAITVTFKLSSESLWDAFQLRINGKLVKSFAGNEDWQTYAYKVPEDGVYSIEVAYVKNAWQSAGEDMLWIDSIALHSGKEAADAIAANPAYPISDEMFIHVLNESARKLQINDPTGNLAARYGDSDFYLVPDEYVNFSFDMTADWDPESAIVYFNFDDQTIALADCLNDGLYKATCGGDSIQTTGYCDSSVVLYPDQYTLGKIVTYFKTEADIDALLNALTKDVSGKVQGTWRYAETEEIAATPEVKVPEGPVEYTLICIDQHGNPVQGAMLQICDEETCQVLISDADGKCSFTGTPYAWEIHVLMSPAGYTADSTNVFLAPVTGGEMTFTFTKAE